MTAFSDAVERAIQKACHNMTQDQFNWMKKKIPACKCTWDVLRETRTVCNYCKTTHIKYGIDLYRSAYTWKSLKNDLDSTVLQQGTRETG